MLKFVIQEHHARTHHFDFRLERHEVFKSKAISKRLSKAIDLKSLAIQVEDHEIIFWDIEKTIPEGEKSDAKFRIGIRKLAFKKNGLLI